MGLQMYKMKTEREQIWRKILKKRNTFFIEHLKIKRFSPGCTWFKMFLPISILYIRRGGVFRFFVWVVL